MSKKITSPSRAYVAMCNKGNWNGYYFRKFTLPKSLAECPHWARTYAALQNIQDKNDTEFAAWYFLNVLDSVACINLCIPAEDFADVIEQKTCSCGALHFRKENICFACEYYKEEVNQ